MKTSRQRVSVVIVNQGRVLGFHAEDPTSGEKYFFLPGGKIEKQESKIQAGIRETLEETGFQITIPEQIPIYERYDFLWDGNVFDSETWFYAGHLVGLEAKSVQDADYHRGVDWVSINELEKYFSYHLQIQEAIRRLTLSPSVSF